MFWGPADRVIFVMQARMKRKEDAKIKKIRQEKRKAKVSLQIGLELNNRVHDDEKLCILIQS